MATIGTQAAARANPDGQTLLVTANTLVMNASLYRSLPYDPEKSFLPIAELATGALALAVNPSTNINSLPELIDLARKKPGEINYASPGRGTPQHLAMVTCLESLTGWSRSEMRVDPGRVAADLRDRVPDTAADSVGERLLPQSRDASPAVRLI